jgi:hypothetical protein
MFIEVMPVFGETHVDVNTTGVLELKCRYFVLAVHLLQHLVTDQLIHRKRVACVSE